MHRNHWQPAELAANLDSILTNATMHQHLRETSAYMRAHPGPDAAAESLMRIIA
jgi:UDP:flavonoid glycosyltransferase YjiC (YdhE family)